MAKKQKDKQPQTDPEAETPEESTPEGAAEASEDALALAGESSEPSDGEGESDEANESSEPSDGEGESDEANASSEGGDAANPYAPPGEGDGDEPAEEAAAGQLGTERYVLAGFFATGMLATYVLGRTFNGVWGAIANKEWFAQALPSLAAVPDDSKGTYSTLLAAVISLVAVYRIYKRPDVRTWSDEVAAELAKVNWPSKKEVSSSTTIVIIASLLATAYLTVLDRLYAFVTNIVYGNGS